MTISDLRAEALSPSTVEQSLPALRRQPAARFYAGESPVDRRRGRSGNLGNRRTDNWLPYSAAFVAQLIAQQLEERRISATEP